MARAPLRSFLGCCRDIMLTDYTDCTDFFARATCFSSTEMADLTDFVSIACSLRH